MSAAIAPPASRNAPCPCGSGLRDKECRGQAATTPPSPGRTITAALIARMYDALVAQREGRFDDAIAAYDEVIRGAPDTYDAWHMRGVAHLQSHSFDAAEADIAHALALCPDLPMGRSNLALVEGNRRNALAEERLSRATLPRFRPLVVDPAEAPLAGVVAGMRVFAIDLGAESGRSVDLVADDARRLGAIVHRITIDENGSLPAAEEAMLIETGAQDVIVGVGCRSQLREWTLLCRPLAIALVADGSLLAPVQDRLRDLSGQGRRREALVDGARQGTASCEPWRASRVDAGQT